MRQSVFIALSLLTVFLPMPVHGAEPISSEVETVPLDKIWAFQMPGTGDVRALEPEKYGESTTALTSAERVGLMHESLTQRIRDSLSILDREKGEKAASGFIVEGNGREALENAFSILVDGKPTETKFLGSKEIALVFFSHAFGDYVHVKHVERRGEVIDVQYRFIPHMTKDMSQHFALIPLGSLPAGNYQVSFTQLPLPPRYATKGQTHVPQEMVEWIVCKPFRFSVEGTEK